MKKKIICLFLTLAMTLCAFSISSVSVSAATKGRTGSNTYCTVKISKNLINKKGKQNATVKIKTYDAAGLWNTGKKVKITLRDGNGRYICSWIGKGGDTLKLGDDHSVYRIYVSYYHNGSSGVISTGNDWTNTGGSYQWKITNPKDCTIS